MASELELRNRQTEIRQIESQVAVYVRHACKHYGSKRNPLVVLDGLNLTVPKGTIYGLLGASGCGKTTLLSCILGQRKLNSGKLWVLGRPPGDKGSSVPGAKIGYMPQETALYGDFTIKETFIYFGWISGMNSKQIEGRSKMLTRLFELPRTNQRIITLSGGEQRRVSLAVALLYEPEVLILDEPTVGLDPLLRESIWNHLIHLSKVKNTTIIMTTHYIEEARQAHIVGLLREGKLLAEGSPERLLQQHQAQTLEEVFLKLIVSQPLAQQPSNSLQDVTASSINGLFSIDDIFSLPSEEAAIHISDFLPTLKYSHMKALIWRNGLWWMRNIPSMALALVFPILMIISFCLCIGQNPHHLPIAVVNYETNNSANCERTVTCNSTQLSCSYLEYLGRHSLILTHYNSEEHAREAVLHGEIFASITIRHNYSAALRTRVNNWQRSNPWDVEFANIEVFSDTSNYHISTYIKVCLYNAFQTFIRDYLGSCDINVKTLNLPIQWEGIYGLQYPNFTDFAVPGALLSMSFLLAVILTSCVMLVERTEVSLERIFIVGITETELLVSHIGCNFFIMAIQATIELTCAFSFFDITQKGSLILVAFLTILTGFCGMCYGMLISSTYNTYTEVNLLACGTFFPVILLSGIFWPVEGMHQVLQWVTAVLPLTKPTESMRNIFQKNWDLSKEAVYMGFVSISIWTIIFLTFSIIVLKYKKG